MWRDAGRRHQPGSGRVPPGAGEDRRRWVGGAAGARVRAVEAADRLHGAPPGLRPQGARRREGGGTPVKQHLHLWIGPVQAFVKQARRTRDLWSGSYLLSFLAAPATRGAGGAEARLVRPKMDDNAMIRWIRGERNGEPPKIGSV